jgi:hypothetical protein
MKRIPVLNGALTVLLIGLLSLNIVVSCNSTHTYYVNSLEGKDSNRGTSPQAAFQSLEKVSQLKLYAGDKVLFARGMNYHGSIEWQDLKGEESQPIFVGSYEPEEGTASLGPVIDASGYRNGILLVDCSHIHIKDLVITADGGGVPDGKVIKKDMRCGVLVTTSQAGTYENIHLESLTIKNVFFEERGFNRGKDEVRTANGSQNYGWGIRVINSRDDAEIAGVTIENCQIRNVAHTGIKFTGRSQTIQNVQILNNIVSETGGPGIQFSGVAGGLVKENDVSDSGSGNDSRKWSRGSGLWTWSCKDFIIEKNSFRNAKGPGDSAGCHIDFNCSNVIVQYNVSENNAGGFCEILGNNYNCSYRYNISINDGYRVKKKNGAFQEGKIFWLSGFVGKGKQRSGPFNSYFYNNTIYVKSDIVAKIAVDRASEGVLLANNIFYIEGKSQAVLGDQYKPETAGESRVKDIIFKNNLFLRSDNWPEDVIIHDSSPQYGNPGFKNAGGKEILDYVPLNTKIIKDQGIEIPKIQGDSFGLFIGLKAEYDIVGNKITGLPDMGAIEMK